MDEKAAEALRLMREIVAEKGADYFYPHEQEGTSEGMCRYLTYDEYGHIPTGPSCIVGHYLVRMGVPLGEIVHQEGECAATAVSATLGWDGEEEREGSALLKALTLAQAAQDEGCKWGEALAKFESELGN